MDKCKAVLSIWAERRKPSEVCKEMVINWATLNQWQNRALEGILQALEPRVQLEKGPALSPRMQALVDKIGCRSQGLSATNKLEERLSKVQESREQKKAVPGRKPGSKAGK